MQSKQQALTHRFREKSRFIQESCRPPEPWVVITPSPKIWGVGTYRPRSKSLFTSSKNPEISSVADERDAKPKEAAIHSVCSVGAGEKNDSEVSGRRTRSNSLTMEFIEQTGSGKHANKLSPSSKMMKDRLVTGLADSESGTTSLHQLFNSKEANPSVEMLRIASSTSPWELRLRDKNGNLPLHMAVDRDDPSPAVVRELLQLFPGAAKAKDKLGNLPLFLACRRKRVQTSVIKAILKAYPEAAKVKIMGALALHHLLHTGSPSPESAQLLIDANPDGPRTANAYGNLPLHYLCALPTPHISTVRVLMSAYPAAVQMKNNRLETPITRALEGCAIKRMESQDGYETDGVKACMDQELSKDTDPALRRERVRLLLRCANAAELSADQKVLLRDLNYEAHRMALLCFVSLCRKYHALPSDAAPGGVNKELVDNANSGSGTGVSAAFRMAICSSDVWRTITSYT